MKWLKYGAIGFVGIIVVAVVVLWILGQRSDAGVMRASVEINRPPAVVWAWLEEKEKFKQWVSWTVDVRDEGPNGVGGKRRTTMKDPNMNGELVVVDSVTREYVPHKYVKVDLSAPMGFDGTVEYQLEDLGGRTHLSVVGKFKYHHWLAGLLEPLVSPQARAKEEADLATLKRLVEQTL
ncbi:MAG: SRPBCC family protein [Bryobacteraceae bacterium]